MITSIRAKIIWTFVALVLLNLGAGFWSIYNFYALGTTVATILRENYQNVLAAENMMKSVERQDNALLVASEQEDTSEGGVFKENMEAFFYWYDRAVRTVSQPSQEHLRDSIQTAYQKYVLRADSMTARIRQGAFSSSKQYYYDVVRPASDELRNLCLTLFEINQAAMESSEARTHTIANQSVYGTMMTSIITLILSIIATAWLTRVLVTPAEHLTETVKQVGRGRLDLKIDVLSNDEIGELSREFNKMTERLKRFEQMNIEQIISEKRKSEAIVESISDGLVVTDVNGRIMHINSVMADLFGTQEQEAAGKPLEDVIKDVRVTKLLRSGSSHNGEESGRATSTFQFELHGAVLDYRPKVTRIYDAEGAPYGVVMLLQDVTQFKELDRMKSEFMAVLSHEFRTPLTSINMTIDILNQKILGPLNEKQKELIDSAREDCFRLTKLARELLQLSKLESGRLQPRKEELDVRSVINFSLHPLQLQFQDKGVALAVDIAPGLPALVADEQQISWAITNLLTNALKYTDPGGTVTVSAREQNGSLLLQVKDTGQGIARENLEKIFDKFVQIKHTFEATPGSVGLGLAIARDIVEMYGGKIWVDSELGKGSIFSILLPLRQVEELSNV